MTGSVIRGRASRTPLPNARDTARPYLHPHFSFSLYSILDTPYSLRRPPRNSTPPRLGDSLS